MRRHALIAATCLLVATLAGCKGCGEENKSLAGLIPADVPGVVVFPDLATTVKDIKGLMDKFSVGPLATFINQGHIEVTRMLGFDPLKLEDLKKLGLDPAAGLAMVPVGEQPVLIAGVSDRKALVAEIEGRMKQLAAAEEHTSKSLDGVEVHTVAAKVGDQLIPQLHYAFAGKYVLMAWAQTKPADLVRMIKLTKEQSLEGAGWYQGLVEKALAKPDLLLVVNANSPVVKGPQAQVFKQYVRQGLVWAFSFDTTGLETRAFVGLADETAKKLAGLSSGVTDTHLERYLPADTVLAYKVRVNVGRLLDEVFDLDPDFKVEFDQAMQAGAKATGSDLERDSVRNLTGNFVFGLSLGSADQINALFSRMAEAPAEMPADNAGLPPAFKVFYWAQVRDAAAWVQVVENLLPMATERSGLQVDKSTAGQLSLLKLSGQELGTSVYLLQKEDLIGGCMGPGCEQTAAELVAGKHKALTTSLSPGAKRLFDEPSAMVGYLNCGLLVEAISGLDANALGEGGMFAKMVLDLALTAVKNLRELTGFVRFTPEGAELSGRLEIR